MIRRSLRHFASVIAFVSLAVSLASATEDWPQFLGPTRDGQSPSATLDAVPKEGWPLRWKAAVGEGFSGPVVVSNSVYLFHRSEGQEVLSAYRATDGSLRWKHALPTSYSAQFGGT
jgi:outer membrane protein assembly factor BamB